MRRTALTALIAAGVAAAGVTTSTQVFAYGAGDLYTRVGVAKIAPKSDNGDINTLGMTGLGVDVDDESGFAFTLGYRFHDRMGLELLAAWPFEHDISIADGAVNGTTKHLPPTLTLQYYPLGGTPARVQPYVGAGINYTHFSDEEVNVPGASLELEDSWGAAGQLGIDVLIDEHWAMNAAAWYIDIDADTNVAGADAGTVEIDPMVVMAGISYRF